MKEGVYLSKTTDQLFLLRRKGHRYFIVNETKVYPMIMDKIAMYLLVECCDYIGEFK
jgi:hypothetical protein